MVLLGVFLFVLGVGIGMTMQNLVLAVQNTVAAERPRRGQLGGGLLPLPRRHDRRLGAGRGAQPAGSAT